MKQIRQVKKWQKTLIDAGKKLNLKVGFVELKGP